MPPTTSAHRNAGYTRRLRTRPRAALLDAFTNELRVGDLVVPAPIAGPRQLPNAFYGRVGTVVSVGRVRIGVRLEADHRVELVPPGALQVTVAVDGRPLARLL